MLTYRAMYKFLQEGVHAEVLDFPGVISCGSNLDEARSMLRSALVDMAETSLLRGEPLPPPNPLATDSESDLEEQSRSKMILLDCADVVPSCAACLGGTIPPNNTIVATQLARVGQGRNRGCRYTNGRRWPTLSLPPLLRDPAAHPSHGLLVLPCFRSFGVSGFRDPIHQRRRRRQSASNCRRNPFQK